MRAVQRENGATFAGCPAGPGSGNLSEVPGCTRYGGYLLIDKVPLEVWTPAGRRPNRVTFRVGS